MASVPLGSVKRKAAGEAEEEGHRTQRQPFTPEEDFAIFGCHLGKSTENVNIFENRTLARSFSACSPLTPRRSTRGGTRLMSGAFPRECRLTIPPPLPPDTHIVADSTRAEMRGGCLLLSC